jgi:hypothetical protein
MAEVVYLVASVLWIVVVLGAAGFAGWFALKVRARRRRANRILALVRVPVALVLATATRRR